MTVSDLPNKITLSCDGVQTEFDFGFKYLQNSDIKVYLPEVGGEADDTNLQVEGSDYTLQTKDKREIGTVVFNNPPADTKEVFIIREEPFDQTSPFKPNTNFPERLIEAGLDKGVMISQQLREQISRCIQLPINAQVGSIKLPNPDPNKALLWDPDGSRLVNSDYDAAGLINDVNRAQEAVKDAEQSANNAATSESQAEYWANLASVAVQQRVLNEMIISPVPLISAALHLADGEKLVYGSNAQYIDYMIKYKKTYPEYFTTEEEWQRQVASNGRCAKYVLDEVAKTIRLPKIIGYIEGTVTPSELGVFTPAGLPNITGGIDGRSNAGKAEGCFYRSTSISGNYAGTGTTPEAIFSCQFDASRSSSIYSDDVTTVQTDSIKVYYYIVVATGVKTDVQVDIDKLVTDLNELASKITNKLDNDHSNDTKPYIVDTYQNGSSWYRVWSDNWCEQGGSTGALGDGSTVTMLKSYRDTAYTLIATMRNPTATATDNWFGPVKVNENTFRISSYKAGGYWEWYACGYLA